MKITIYSEKERLTISCEENESILAAYQRQVDYVTAVCGGRGICGKCKIKVIEGSLPVTEADLKCFSEEELRQGYRLSCKAIPKMDCKIEICFVNEDSFVILESFEGKKDDYSQNNVKDESENLFGIAIDIGTTTLAAQLVKIPDGKVLATASSMNHQRAFGADVISRIEASVSGKGNVLRKLIQKDLQKITERLLDKPGVSAGNIESVIISGNTTMEHLLMEYSCNTLGRYPFEPVNIDVIEGSFSEVIGKEYFNNQENIPKSRVYLLPGISTYVGGDIVSGLYAYKFHQENSVNLFIDLGTNGEMAIGNQNRLLVTSTAAGPAFEGGNISCGTGSISGAICHVKINEDKKPIIKTIQGQTPIGICGTGVLEITAELLKTELLDETGLLDEVYFETGYPIAVAEDGKEICFTQKDVREIQLAKAAVRAGVETLIKQYGVSYADINKVYLAGGMGFQMDHEAAVEIGMLPKELREKICVVGNSSLAGAVCTLRDGLWKENMKKLINLSKEVQLSNDAEFNEFYMKYIMFGEE